ncbi:MAG: hypothetical protein RSC38_05205 [Oscillospiraceae bacterium]
MHNVIRFRGKDYWRKIAVTVVAALAALMLLIAALSYNATVQRAVNRGYTGSAYEFSKELANINIEGTDKQLCVYLTSVDNVACAVVRKGILGYRLMGLSGSIPIKSAEAQLSIKSGFSSLGSADTINWGIVYSKDIKAVTVNGKDAPMYDLPQIGRVWYHFAKRDYSANTEIQFVQ